MKLSNFTQGRDNNFNLIRIIAALAVLITHSFALSMGSGEEEPFRKSLDMTMGSVAVDVFFVTSGFLVTSSLFTRQSTIEFVWARVLRIYPALLIMLFLTVFGLGVFFTTLPLTTYLTDANTYFYLIKCATLISGIAFDLPGVFEGNPFKNQVNASLWTMPYEVRMYAFLAITWISLRYIKRDRLKTFELIIISSAIVAGIFIIARDFLPSFFPQKGHFAQLFFMFFSGASFYVLKEYITLSRSTFWIFVIALLMTAIADKHAFFLVYTLTIAYILFYVAYVPSGRIRKYNLVGDYSYGVYIYAFPIQQSVAALIPGVSVLTMIFISAIATLFFAAVSWHLIERRALNLKGLYVGHTRRIFRFEHPDNKRANENKTSVN